MVRGRSLILAKRRIFPVMGRFIERLWHKKVMLSLATTVPIHTARLPMHPRRWFHFVVSGASMNPSLHEGNHLLVNPFAYSKILPVCGMIFIPPHPMRWRRTNLLQCTPRRGDIVVVAAPAVGLSTVPHTPLIKRLVGLPGETVRVVKGRLYVNGSPIVEPYITTSPLGDPTVNDRTYTLTEDKFFVLGDNRNASADSRVFGPINRQMILGKVLLVIQQRIVMVPPERF